MSELGRLLQVLVLLVVTAALCYPVFARARARARVSSRARTLLITKAVAGIVAGALIALLLPTRVPETPGSPGTLVMIAMLWVLGGGLAFTSALVLAGAAAGRPPV
jgi:hypothetical protein